MLEIINRFILPPVNSTVAGDVDALFTFINVVSVIILLGITVAIVYFSIKYKRKTDDDVTPVIRHNTALEVTWTVIPLILILIVFFWGFRGYVEMRTPPQNAYEVYVTASSFFWQFTHPNGVQTTGELHVPNGRPVKLIMQSRDVIHSFFVPDYRIKQDVLPGRYTTAWFQTNEAVESVVFCTEYCGSGHSAMLAKVISMEPADFNAWLLDAKTESEREMPLADLGRSVYQNQGCIACHSLDGNAGIGPSFKGLFGSNRTFTDGTSREADEEYIKQSIYDPRSQIVEGFTGVMISYQGIIDDQQVNALIEFIKEQN
ncbi:MAG TPA: cytochrome c oxidase subunit II [Bacteroidetes bacterium]|nr:cytochrome c oxidase subunit II [Bacteroidota bacterium]